MKLTLMYNVLLLVMFPVSENNVRLLQEIKRKNLLTSKKSISFCTKNDNFQEQIFRSVRCSLTYCRDLNLIRKLFYSRKFKDQTNIEDSLLIIEECCFNLKTIFRFLLFKFSRKRLMNLLIFLSSEWVKNRF